MNNSSCDVSINTSNFTSASERPISAVNSVTCADDLMFDLFYLQIK